MVSRLVIVGAGGFGRALYEWVRLSPKHCEDTGVSEVVFLDDSRVSIKTKAPIIGTVENYRPDIHDVMLLAIGSPQVRMKIAAALQERAVRYHTFISDQAVVADSAVIGAGTVICPGVVIDPDVKVESQCHVNKNCSIGHDSRLGKYSTLSPLVNVMGGVIMGRRVFVGGSAAILPSIKMADDAVVGAGATVTRDVDRGMTVVGNPARPL